MDVYVNRSLEGFLHRDDVMVYLTEAGARADRAGDAAATTPGVEEKALVDAVYERARREYAYLLARRRRRRPRGEHG